MGSYGIYTYVSPEYNAVSLRASEFAKIDSPYSNVFRYDRLTKLNQEQVGPCLQYINRFGDCHTSHLLRIQLINDAYLGNIELTKDQLKIFVKQDPPFKSSGDFLEQIILNKSGSVDLESMNQPHFRLLDFMFFCFVSTGSKKYVNLVGGFSKLSRKIMGHYTKRDVFKFN